MISRSLARALYYLLSRLKSTLHCRSEASREDGRNENGACKRDTLDRRIVSFGRFEESAEVDGHSREVLLTGHC